jgi:hypothetical protein
MADRSAPTIWHVSQSTGKLCMARVIGWDGSLITQADVTSIAWNVVDESAEPAASVDSGSLTVADVIYDTAQSGDNWPYTDGYNFAYQFPASKFPNANRNYCVQILVTPASGEVYHIGPFYLHTHKTH